MKKVLFVIQTYPARRSANVRCDEKLIRVLLEAGGYDIHVFTYEYWGRAPEETKDGIKIHRLRRSFFWRRYTWAMENAQTKRGWRILILNRLRMRLAQLLTLPVYPHYEPFLERKYARAVWKLHQKEKFDLVIAEHNGMDTLYAGHYLKKKDPGIKFLPILWDPITGREPAKYLPKKAAVRKLAKAEAAQLGNADRIIAMASSRAYHAEHSVKKPYYDRITFLDIPGILPPPEGAENAPLVEDGKINIVFAGIVNLNMRNPERILHILDAVNTAQKIRVIFLCTGNAIGLLEKLRASSSCEIVINGYVSPPELSAIYRRADMLLNLGNTLDSAVPSKIFEYMSYGKPILSTYKIDHDTSQSYLQRYPLACCVDERKPLSESAEQIEDFLNTHLGQTIPFGEVADTFKENTPRSYLELIEAVLSQS